MFFECPHNINFSYYNQKENNINENQNNRKRVDNMHPEIPNKINKILESLTPQLSGSPANLNNFEKHLLNGKDLPILKERFVATGF